MNHRAVSALTLGLALTGCAQSRSAQPPSRASDPIGLGVGLPPVRESINAGLPPGSATTAPMSIVGQRSIRSLDGDAASPVRIKNLPSLRESINAGLPRVGVAAQRSDHISSPTRSTTSMVAPIAIRDSAALPIQNAIRVPEPNPEIMAPVNLPVLPPDPVTLSRETAPVPLVREPESVAATIDPSVNRTSATHEEPDDSQVMAIAVEKAEKEAIRSGLARGTIVGLSVATVDGEHISLAELVSGVEDYRTTYIPDGQSLTNEERNQLAGIILQQLIDRTLLIQEAKRRLLTSEQKEKMFNEHVGKQWQEQEIPKLCRKNKVKNEYRAAPGSGGEGQIPGLDGGVVPQGGTGS